MLKNCLILISILLAFLAGSLLLAGIETPDGNSLWLHITAESPYTAWKGLGARSGEEKASAHGPFHRVYVNDAGAASKTPPMKYGTVIVKENLSREGAIASVTVMHKIESYNPAGGDWFWVKYAPNGLIERSGKIPGCIGCHRSVRSNDYVFGGFLRE